MYNKMFHQKFFGVSSGLYCLLWLTAHFQYCSSAQSIAGSNAITEYPEDFPRVRLPPFLTTEELIKRRGYPLETHDIQTQDDYILTVQRIPYGKAEGGKKGEGGKFPVYIVHGSAQSSADWVANLNEDDCLPFRLANAGFDVWIGNIRGTAYSSRHIKLSNENTAFWNFSIDELAKYDLPNTIDYILAKSNSSRLHYIGFSLGNTIFYMTMAGRPEYNHKIGLHVSYSPVVFFSTFPKIWSIMSLFIQPLGVLQKVTKGFPIPPQGLTFLVNQVLSVICSQRIFVGLCRQIFFVFGYGPRNSIEEQTASVLGHLFTPSAMKILIHILQMVQSDRFCRYDEGPLQNERLYGQKTPPSYDLAKVSAPVALFFGTGDVYANRRGMDRLASGLPNVIDFYTVPGAFTHLDFMYGTRLNNLVYNHTVHLLNKFSSNSSPINSSV